MHFDVLYKIISIFFAMLFLTRILGKKQMGQLTYFNYVTGIVFGSIAGSVIAEKQLQVKEGLIGLAAWTILTLLMEYISYKFRWIRSALDGQPTMVVKEGKIIRNELSKIRLDLDDLLMLLRNNGTTNLDDVTYAILESNGRLSVVKNDNLKPLTKKDMNISSGPQLKIPGALIIEGKILKNNLRDLNVNEQWLIDQLKINGISSPKEIFYAELKPDRTININKF